MKRLFLSALLGLAACGSDAQQRATCGPDGCTPAAFDIRVGGAVDAMRGTGGFATVDDGTDLPLRPGSQGGLHVYMNLQLSDEAVQVVTEQPIVYRVGRRVRDGKLVSRTEFHESLVRNEDGQWETETSIRVFLCPVAIGVDVADELIEMTVELKPDYGEEPVARGTLRFVPRCVSGDSEAFCQQICFWQ